MRAGRIRTRGVSVAGMWTLLHEKVFAVDTDSYSITGIDADAYELLRLYIFHRGGTIVTTAFLFFYINNDGTGPYNEQEFYGDGSAMYAYRSTADTWFWAPFITVSNELAFAEIDFCLRMAKHATATNVTMRRGSSDISPVDGVTITIDGNVYKNWTLAQRVISLDFESATAVNQIGAGTHMLLFGLKGARR
jgi:hypothetical protein